MKQLYDCEEFTHPAHSAPSNSAARGRAWLYLKTTIGRDGRIVRGA